MVEHYLIIIFLYLVIETKKKHIQIKVFINSRRDACMSQLL